MHCNLRPADVAPAVLEFNYKTHNVHHISAKSGNRRLSYQSSRFRPNHLYRATACSATHGIANRPFCLSVHLSNAWIVTKRKELGPKFLYHMKDHSS